MSAGGVCVVIAGSAGNRGVRAGDVRAGVVLRVGTRHGRALAVTACNGSVGVGVSGRAHAGGMVRVCIAAGNGDASMAAVSRGVCVVGRGGASRDVVGTGGAAADI